MTKVPAQIILAFDEGPNGDNMSASRQCEFVKQVDSYLHDPESFWYPYISSFPTSCQSLGCYDLESLSDLLTVRGTMEAKDVLCNGDNDNDVLGSVVFSRYFNVGLIPILDLYNHNSQR